MWPLCISRPKQVKMNKCLCLLLLILAVSSEDTTKIDTTTIVADTNNTHIDLNSTTKPQANILVWFLTAFK